MTLDVGALAEAGLAYSLDGVVATITLDRPAVRNAQTPLMWRRLAELGARLPDAVRVVVVTGAGASFSAGLDRAMLDPTRPGEETVAGLLRLSDQELADTIGEYQQGFTFLRDPRFVSIAKVRGHAIGAGFQLALACDLLVLSENATLSMREAALGLVPDLTGTKSLVERVGYSRALEICASARSVMAAEAVRIGIATDAVPDGDLDHRVESLIADLTGPMPGAVREIKQILMGAAMRDLDQQREVERTAQVRRFREIAALTAGD